MTISSVFSDRTPSTNPTFWGDPTSSVNWCETDYTITLYIAEFFNSTSSLCMVLFGVLGNYMLRYLRTPPKKLGPLTKDQKELSTEVYTDDVYDPVLEHNGLSGLNRVRATWYALQIVGWGSVAFHGSLQWWAQAFDEVPMVWTASLQLTTMLCGRYDPFPISTSSQAQSLRKSAGWKNILIPSLHKLSTSQTVPILSNVFLSYGVLCSLLLTLFRGPTQFLYFHVTFATVELGCFYSSYRILADVNRTVAGKPTRAIPRHAAYSGEQYTYLTELHQKDIRKLYHRGVWTYGVAVLIWSIDLNFCPYVSDVPIAYPSFSPETLEIIWNWTTFNPQGHAWWHLLVSIGFYYLHILAAYDRLIAAYSCFWEGVETGDEGCLALLKEEKVKGRKLAMKTDVPVVEWLAGGLLPVIKIWRFPASRRSGAEPKKEI